MSVLLLVAAAEPTGDPVLVWRPARGSGSARARRVTLKRHLRKVFDKLGITSRRALRDALPDPSGLPLRT